MSSTRPTQRDSDTLPFFEEGHTPRPKIVIAQEQKCTGKRGVSRAFRAAIDKIAEEISALNAGVEYCLVPVLVATHVDTAILDHLPTAVGPYKVKTLVNNGSLYVTAVSDVAHHNAGMNEIRYQTASWCVSTSRGYFESFSDVNLPSGNNSAAPDLAVTVNYRYTREAVPPKLVIVELEVSHRDCSDMRADYLHYFQDHPELVSVIAVHFYGTVECPGMRALAVQWSRDKDAPGPGGTGVTVTDAKDFGILPISVASRGWFAQDPPLRPSLPPVPPALWEAQNRCAPVRAEGLGLPADQPLTSQQARAATEWILQQPHSGPLYQAASESDRPLMRVPSASLMEHVQAHCTSVGEAVGPVEDFVFDLGRVFMKVTEASGYLLRNQSPR